MMQLTRLTRAGSLALAFLGAGCSGTSNDSGDTRNTYAPQIPCLTDAQCPEGMYCDEWTIGEVPDPHGGTLGVLGDGSQKSSSEYYCVPLRNLGQECSAEDPCAEGLHCHEDGSNIPPRSLCVPDSCTYPVEAPTGTSRQLIATQQFQQLTPTASVAWNPETNTFASVTGLDFDISCATTVADALRALVAAKPFAFQMEPDEWTFPSTTCAQVSISPNFYKATRNDYGIFSVARDNINFRLVRQGTQVKLLALTATYMPEAESEVESKLLACEPLTEAEIAATLQASTLPHVIFNQCNEVGTRYYAPMSSDVITVTAANSVSWYESGATVLMTRPLRLEYRVPGGANLPEFVGSSAVCPLYDSVGNFIGYEVGWRVTLDAITGEVLSTIPGITCTVC